MEWEKSRIEAEWLVGWLILNVPVNNFSVMLGRSHFFLGITSTFWGVNVPCSRTQHGLTRVGLEPLTSGSGVRGINHQATAIFHGCKNDNFQMKNCNIFLFLLKT